MSDDYGDYDDEEEDDEDGSHQRLSPLHN